MAPRSISQRGLGLPNQVFEISPVPVNAHSQPQDQCPGGFILPLNIIGMIVSNLGDMADLARLTRTSRVLYYMALPQLYQHVTLRSYPEIRRVDGRVEGLGSGSPLCMALSGLSTTPCAAVVKRFCLVGAWKESGEYLQGRIPDVAVLLSVVVRGVIDKMSSLKHFSWELETKPLITVYQGLAARSMDSLASFTLVFSISRTPRPVTILPAMPNLKHFQVRNLDPLCYNDDISLLLLNSRKLESLKMHWNPRMRREAEGSSSLTTYLGRCIEAGYKLKLKIVGFQNFYGPNRGQFAQTLDQPSMMESHFLDMFGGAHGPRTNVFIDDTWKRLPQPGNFNWKIHRSNELAIQHTRILNGFTGLEELYLSNATLQPGVPTMTDSPIQNQSSPNSGSSQSSTPTPGVTAGSDLSNLGKEYLRVILKNHGPTLRNLLLFDKFVLDMDQVADLIRSCPGLEQLGITVAPGMRPILGHIIASLPKLKALRLYETPWQQEEMQSWSETDGNIRASLGRDYFFRQGRANSWLGLGNSVYRINGPRQFDIGSDVDEMRYDVTTATLEDVAHIKIWSMDSLDL